MNKISFRKFRMWLSEQDHQLAILLAVMISMTFFIFAPIQLYINNMSKLWFSIGALVAACLPTGLFVFFLLVTIALLLRGRLRSVYFCLLLGVGMALYIQGNFVTTDYGVLDGSAIDWGQYTFTAVWNTLLWLGCLLLPFIIKKFFQKQSGNTFKLISAFLTGVQLLSLCVLCVMTDFSGYQKSDFYLSKEGLYTVSEKENVIIFVLDAFDCTYLDEIIAEDPSFAEPLDGFTCFRNATSAYSKTIGSLPYMLTQQYYENEQPYEDYIDEAYWNTDYYQTLKENGYDIGIYTNNSFVSDATKATYLDNSEDGSLQGSSLKLEKAMLQFTAFRYFPHIAKKNVWFYSGIFDEIKDSGNLSEVYSADTNNLEFYKSLVDNGLKTKINEKVYRFIHLDGAHYPFNLTEDIVHIEKELETPIPKAKAALKIVYEYLHQMKDKGIYNNSVILIVADHGKFTTANSSPVFLVKGFQEAGRLKYSDAPVSHENMFATVMEELSLNGNNKYGVSVYSTPADSSKLRRYFKFSSDNLITDDGYLVDFIEYHVLADNNTPENFFLTGNMYAAGERNKIPAYEYQLDDEIIFTQENDGMHYFSLRGISASDGESSWSEGQNARLRIDFGDEKASLIAKINFSTIYLDAERIIVSSQGDVLYEGVISNDNLGIEFFVPEKYTEDGTLVLDFRYPDACSPKSRNTGPDVRELAVKYKDIKFSKLSEQLYEPGTELLFSEGENGFEYFSEGLGDDGWSVGKKAEMKVFFGDTASELTADIQFWGIYIDRQRLIIQSGNTTLYDNIVTSEGSQIQFKIPRNCLNGNMLQLTFEYPDAVSPVSRNENGDSREIAFKYRSICFSEDSENP